MLALRIRIREVEADQRIGDGAGGSETEIHVGRVSLYRPRPTQRRAGRLVQA